MSDKLFSYGIFENPDTTYRVTGSKNKMVKAVLYGYRKVMTTGHNAKMNWWMAYPEEGSHITGTLIHDIDRWEEFDAIEDVGDGWYERQIAKAVDADGPYEVYVYGAGEWAREYIRAANL